jgi:hypothetical protein
MNELNLPELNKSGRGTRPTCRFAYVDELVTGTGGLTNVLSYDTILLGTLRGILNLSKGGQS